MVRTCSFATVFSRGWEVGGGGGGWLLGAGKEKVVGLANQRLKNTVAH